MPDRPVSATPAATPLCDPTRSQLLVIDIQGRLAAAMDPADRARVLANSGLLVQGASTLAIPVLVSEQYPRGLGPTETDLGALISESANARVLEKTCFSCARAEDIHQSLRDNGRSQVVITGMESHICVLQTALELHVAGFQVFVAEDAVCSRRSDNHQNAMARLRQAGVIVSNSESVLFEWLGDARHPHFKQLSALVK